MCNIKWATPPPQWLERGRLVWCAFCLTSCCFGWSISSSFVLWHWRQLKYYRLHYEILSVFLSLSLHVCMPAENILSVTAIVLANLCVAYIMTSANEAAEELMRQIEKEEERVQLQVRRFQLKNRRRYCLACLSARLPQSGQTNSSSPRLKMTVVSSCISRRSCCHAIILVILSWWQDPQKQVYHLCIVNLVIGTLYCAKGIRLTPWQLAELPKISCQSECSVKYNNKRGLAGCTYPGPHIDFVKLLIIHCDDCEWGPFLHYACRTWLSSCQPLYNLRGLW